MPNILNLNHYDNSIMTSEFYNVIVSKKYIGILKYYSYYEVNYSCRLAPYYYNYCSYYYYSI